MMGNISGYRKGNLVDYSGILGPRHFAKIDNLEQFEGETKFWFKKQSAWDKEFVSYEKDIKPIYFDEKFLKELGLQFDPHTNAYIHGYIVIATHNYLGGTDAMHLHLGSWGWFILPPGVEVKSVKDVSEKAIPLPALHYLQNYFEDQGVSDVDFDVLTKLRMF